MNIGIFTDTYQPQINGVVTSVTLLKKELEELGHNVYVITAADPKEKTPERGVYRAPSFPFIFLPSFRAAFFYPPKLILTMNKLKLDVIHTQTEFSVGLFGKIVSNFYRIPSVHTYHTMYEDYVHYVLNGHLITPKMAQQYSRVFCNSAKIVIAPARKAKQALIEYGVKKHIEVVPTGFDFSHFNREKYTKEQLRQVREELGLSPNNKVIVSVCRVAKEKSLDVVIKQMPALLKKLPEAKLVIVGEGPSKDELIELAQSLNISSSVIFAGSRPWLDIPKYYMSGDCFVSASTSETQGLTYIESMACKVPVVAKKDPSIDEILIDTVTGYSFETDEECADKLYEALTQQDGNRKIIETAYNHIQGMSSKSFARAVESIYQEAINSKPQKWYHVRWSELRLASYIIDLKKLSIKEEEEEESTTAKDVEE